MRYRVNLISSAFFIGLLASSLASAQSNQYIRNQQSSQPADFNITGAGQADIFAARSEFHLAGQRMLRAQGDRNLFVGADAGSGGILGTDNAFVGYHSGRFNNAGSFNAFLGTYSGSANTSGTRNSFVGYQSGYDNSTGFENSFFGYRSGFSNTTGAFNVFLGTFAGFSNTTGGDNIFIGGGSGRASSASSFNVFVGAESGVFNTLGEENAFLGRQSGMGNTSGGRNTFLGNAAGFANTTGSNNTALGSLANFGSGNLSFATAVGANSVVTESNMIQLGRNGLDVVRLGTLAGGGFTPLCVDGSNTIAFCSSSGRYKSKVRNYESSFALLNRLQPISFSWESGTRDLGLVAEEVAKIEPLLATYNAKGEVEGVKYDRIGVVLINVVKEQQATIEQQRKQLDASDAKIRRLESQLEALTKAVCSFAAGSSVCGGQSSTSGTPANANRKSGGVR